MFSEAWEKKNSILIIKQAYATWNIQKPKILSLKMKNCLFYLFL